MYRLALLPLVPLPLTFLDPNLAWILNVGLSHPPRSYSGAVGVLGCDTYAGGGGESKEPEPEVEDELDVVIRTATGLVLNERVSGRGSVSIILGSIAGSIGSFDARFFGYGLQRPLRAHIPSLRLGGRISSECGGFG